VTYAAVGVAFGAFSEIGAGIAAARKVARDAAVTSLGTTTTVDGTAGPAVPAGDGTVYSAAASATAVIVGESGAGIAGARQVAGDRSVAPSPATSTGHSASRPAVPASDEAVYGAAVGIAFGAFSEIGAGIAAARKVAGDAAVTSFGTTTTVCGTAGPTIPSTDGTVYDAAVGVAFGGIREAGAGIALARKVAGDCAVARLGTTTTVDGAAGPSVPSIDGTVDSAAASVAVVFVGETRAGIAVVVGVASDSSVAPSPAAAAVHSATRPSVPA